jgi:secreted trypsin-like serine protease
VSAWWEEHSGRAALEMATAPGAPRRSLLLGAQTAVAWSKTYMVAFKHNATTRDVLCAGVLVTSWYVLTTAQCGLLAFPAGGQPATVMIGTVYPASLYMGGQMRTAARLRLHPDWDPVKKANDIALVQLAGAAQASFVPIALARYGGKSEATLLWGTAIVTGWGWDKPTKGKTTWWRLEQYAPIVNISTCTGPGGYNVTRLQPRTSICAGYVNKAGVGPCVGDLGDPLFLEFGLKDTSDVLFGLFSWADGCGVRNKLGVYTLVRPYTSWIQSTVGTKLRLEPQTSA